MLSLSKDKRKPYQDEKQKKKLLYNPLQPPLTLYTPLSSSTRLDAKGNQLMSDFDRSASNQVVQSFSFRVQQPFSLSDTTDNTVCWRYSIPILKANEKQLFLLTQGFQTIILDYIGQSFPSCIAFGLKNVAGYIDKRGSVTNRVIVMDLVSTTIKSSPTGIVARDLVYKAQLYNLWNLGLNRDLQMYLYVDEETQPVTLPIINPITVNFKIVHVANI